MQRFVKGDSHDAGDLTTTSNAKYAPNRPATAQTIRNVHDEQAHDTFDTDSDAFDVTNMSLNTEHHVGSDGSEAGPWDQIGPEGDDQAIDINMPPYDGRFDGYFRDILGDGLIQTANSYPATTSGEPEPLEDLEGAQRPDPGYEGYGGVGKRDSQDQLKAHITMPERGRQSRKEEIKLVPVPSIQQHQYPLHQLQQKPKTVPQNTAQPIENRSRNVRQPATTRTPAHFKMAVPKLTVPPENVTYEVQQQIQHQHQNQHRHQHEQDIEDRSQQFNTRGYNLDHPLEDLYKKDFGALQNEPFDGPNDVIEPVSHDISSLPLEQKLTKYAKEHPTAQISFFASLNIDEWEEAGDWFRERFAEVFDKLKDARKARRQTAQKFELEIKQREESVVRKRKITDEALADMKKSGAAVLLNTPKKKKKKKQKTGQV